MPEINEYKRETTRRAMQAMAASQKRDPEYMAMQRAMFDVVLDIMHTSLDGLEVMRRENHIPGFTFKEANKWIDLLKEIAPIVLGQAPFGYGPVKALPILVTKIATTAGAKIPEITKAVNTTVDVLNTTSAIMTPLAWSEKIAAAAGSHFAVPIGVKTALAPTMANLAKQIATWSHLGAGTLGTVLANFTVLGPVFSHGLTAFRVYQSYSKLDGVQSVLDHYEDHHCDCHAGAERIVALCQSATGDLGLAATGVGTLKPAYHALEKKAHAIANKFRSAENRTHRQPYEIAVSLLKGAQSPSGNTGCPVHDGDRSGRCPIAMLTIATLFGNGDPTKGYKAAVAAIQSTTDEGANKLKAKI